MPARPKRCFYPAILTLALIGVLILLQWLVVDLWGWIMRARKGRATR